MPSSSARSASTSAPSSVPEATAAAVIADGDRWNHNLHYSRVVLQAIPPGTQAVLDVGCGEGTLTRALRRVVPTVTGIDADPASIDRARQQDEASRPISYVLGDILAKPLAGQSFDAVVSVAVLHHMDAAAGLAAMKDLVKPGGVLVVLGLARSRLPRDLPWEGAAVGAQAWLRSRRTYWEQTAPTVWPPPATWVEMRRLAHQQLPGARFRRHLLWRYSIVWTKPAA
jgi:SAM-dependent methyltransferase